MTTHIPPRLRALGTPVLPSSLKSLVPRSLAPQSRTGARALARGGLNTARRPPTGEPRTVSWPPLAVILCGTFVYILDFFIVNVALPSIQHGLSASPAAIEWVVAGYGLTSAAFLVTGGRLGDHYGRRRAFCIGLAAFTLTSALCAAAPDAGFLVAARLAQGIGAGIMAPNVLSILGTTYAGPDRVRAISAYGIVMGIAAAGGQLLGGVLIDANLAGLGWRVIFWVNVPVGIAAIAAARKWVPESRAATPGKLDLRGAALFTTALIALVLPLLDGRAHGWPAWSLACLAASPVLLAAFAAWLRQPEAARRPAAARPVRSSRSAPSGPG